MTIAFKIKVVLVCAAGFSSSLSVWPLLTANDATDTVLRTQQTIVSLQGGTFSYPVAGDFTRDGKQVEAPLVEVRFPSPVAIMKNRVSAADYHRCVEDGACAALDHDVVIAPDRPAVQVSWYDADHYAGWLTRKTGETYRLPTDEEWTFASESKFGNGSVPTDYNEATHLSAHHEHEANRELVGSGEPVSEWTNTCFVRAVLNDDGAAVSRNRNCGVRVVEGEHRAYVTDFIRDARAAGCEAGTPPDNLGFRLVHEEKTWTALYWLNATVAPEPLGQLSEFQVPPNKTHLSHSTF
jgi:formylglycine-generating enzyme required for sulfatase activity